MLNFVSKSEHQNVDNSIPVVSKIRILQMMYLVLRQGIYVRFIANILVKYLY